MIRFLKGIVEELGEDSLSLDVNGVGYQAFASGRTLDKFAMGEVVKIHILTYVREDQFTLYGFADTTERDVCELITKVNGVGMKVAMAILSALSPEDIIQAITLQDGKMLAQANGVGPKLGERIVRELKDKVGAVGSMPLADGATVSEVKGGSATADVFSALSNLGYKPAQAQKAIKIASENIDVEATFDTLLKASLAALR
jgi:Holliday junction DNA helicase RuvA